MINLRTFFSRIMGIGEVQRQSLVWLVWQIAITFIGFLSTIYFAHAVGASVLGAYFLFLAYYGIIGMVTDGGFGGAAVKRISEGKEQDEYFSAFIVLRSIFGAIVIIALIFFRNYFIDLNASGVFIWILVILFVSIFSGIVSHGIAGRGKMGIRSTCNFIGEVTRILVQVAGIFLGFEIFGLVGGFAAGLLIVTAIEWRFLDLHFVRFEWRHIKSLSTFSFWLFLTSSGAVLYSQTDTIMLGYYLSNADVGVYRVIFQFTTLATFTVTALGTSLYPKISRWGQINEIGLIEVSLSRSFSFSLLLAVPIFAGGILLGDKLLYFFYGAEFANGYFALILLLTVQVVSIFQYLFSIYLSALDRVKFTFKVTLFAAAANIVLNFILIPIIGVTGAAAATLVTILLNVFLTRNVLSKIITIRVERSSLWNILKASFVLSIMVIFYRYFVPLSNIWLTLFPVLLGGVMYGFLILKFDTKIHSELKKIATQMNLPWPHWFMHEK